jgi:hypothetical protein
MEDTEAVIGGAANRQRAEDFFSGPVKTFLQKVDAALIIAVQSPGGVVSVRRAPGSEAPLSGPVE